MSRIWRRMVRLTAAHGHLFAVRWTTYGCVVLPVLVWGVSLAFIPFFSNPEYRSMVWPPPLDVLSLAVLAHLLLAVFFHFGLLLLAWRGRRLLDQGRWEEAVVLKVVPTRGFLVLTRRFEKTSRLRPIMVRAVGPLGRVEVGDHLRFPTAFRTPILAIPAQAFED